MTWRDPPKSWDVITGTWGTDLDRAESSALYRSGNYSLHLKNTAVASKIRSGFVPMQTVPVTAEYQVGALIYPDAVGAGYNFTIKVERYPTRDSLLSTSTFTFTPATAAWQWVSGKYTAAFGGGFLKVSIEKTTNTHNIYVDRVILERAPPRLDVEMTGGQSIPTGTWTTVDYGATGGQYGFTEQVTDEFLCDVPGYYTVSASCQLEALSDQTEAGIRIKVVGAATDYYYGTHFAASGSHDVVLTVPAAMILLQAGDTIEVEIWHNEGSNLNIPVSNDYKRFLAVRSERL